MKNDNKTMSKLLEELNKIRKINVELEHRIVSADGKIKYLNEKCETYYDKKEFYAFT